MKTKERVLKSMRKELKDIEKSYCLTLKDMIEKRNAIVILNQAISQIKNCKNYNNEKGKDLLHKMLESLE